MRLKRVNEAATNDCQPAGTRINSEPDLSAIMMGSLRSPGALALAVVLCFAAVELQFEQSKLNLIATKIPSIASKRRKYDDTVASKIVEELENEFFVNDENTGQAFLDSSEQTSRRKFYLLPLPEVTSFLTGNFTERASQYYKQALNEEQAEIWLHRRLMKHPDRTEDPEEADIVIVCAYLHLNMYLLGIKEEKQIIPMDVIDWGNLLRDRIIPGKLHTIAIPTWNPTVSAQIGIKEMSRILDAFPVPTMALGFERNDKWSRVPPDRIVPIPYVASPSVAREELLANFDTERLTNFVFYAGDHRKHADAWAGCNRSQLVHKLDGEENMDVKLRAKGQRISQSEYNTRMLTSDFCLILCGDTPTSRSLASAVLHGCVPLIIGSRLRGLCEPPCHLGWGWTVAGKSHIPFTNLVEWDFPELDEAKFGEDPMTELTKAFGNETRKNTVRNRMKEWHLAWVYGWGDPLTSNDFGMAVDYAWKSLVRDALG